MATSACIQNVTQTAQACVKQASVALLNTKSVKGETEGATVLTSSPVLALEEIVGAASGGGR